MTCQDTLWGTMQNKLNVLTACSGIGAPEHAWRDLPFNFIGCSEIEPFPSAVLQHHYPTVKNYGDMTKYRDWKLNEPASIIFAGTPCQSFSVAGLRQGMASPNGNLALVFLGMVERFAPRWVIYENVPGLLSSNGGRDFGAFLGALGELGFGYCYRTLDSQFFNVPQRRKRVFVVGYLGDWRRAAAVLFERESLSGGITKSRKTRQKVAPSVTTGPPYSRTENERVEVDALVVNRKANEAKDVSDIVMQSLYREKGHGDYTASDTTGTLLAQEGKRAVDLVTWPAEIGNTLGADYGDKRGANNQHINAGAPYFIPSQDRVRRITCGEAEKLQGFEPGYTDIEYRGKPAPDSQRYKALGNSMTVDVVKWIGQRIQMVEAVSNE